MSEALEARTPNVQEPCSPYFLPEQAAEYLHVSVTTLARWRQSGKGPRYRKHGRTPVYTQAALDVWSSFQGTAHERE